MTDGPCSEQADWDEALALLARALRFELDRLTQTGVSQLPKVRLRLPTAPVVSSSPPRQPAPAPTPPSEPVPAASSPPAAEAGDDPASKLVVLEQTTLGDCTRCKLHRGRNRIVFGVGNPNADLLFVGEGPGADEDRRGEPFVGRAGELLTRMIEAGMRMRRDDVYICNVVKCRPPNNRDPEADEVEACEPFLKSQLAIVQPKVIVGLGRIACQTLLRTRAPIGRLRGRWTAYEGIPFMPTFHPAYLLRSPEKKREAWEDLKQVMAKLAE